ncbi:hypothetical protein GJ496_001956 [Pomphorhynchus laevis]|nr:hypothetical protein GJ496_001956 [Pomphorhynchus laevis]
MVTVLIDNAICDAGGDIRCPGVAEYLDCNYTTEQWKCTRERFFIPKFGHFPNLQYCVEKKDEECIYLCGHSLGLQQRDSVQICHDVLTSWGTLGALSHCLPNNAFNACDTALTGMMAKLVGAEENEIAIMNSLTINIHLMMASFYQPDSCRFKILHEENIFSSDRYALESVVRRYGLDPITTLISAGNCQEDVMRSIEEHSTSIALILIGSVQYLTGYRFDLKPIVDAGHNHGAIVGFVLAHAVGVVPLCLHEDNVDFAVWCTYKYMCGGPSSAAAVFIHQSHHQNEFCGRMDGWWGSVPESRLLMSPELIRAEGANGFRVSHPNPFQCNLLKPVLKMLTSDVTMEEVYNRGLLLTEYLIRILKAQFPCIVMLTPEDPEKRGFHVAIKSPHDGEDECSLQDKLANSGIFVDTRLGHLRISVHPLYTTFIELYRFALCLSTLCSDTSNLNGLISNFITLAVDEILSCKNESGSNSSNIPVN